MAKHHAIAEDGPVGGKLDLTVENGDWPKTVVWTTGLGADQRHVYRLHTVALAPHGIPSYRFDRTLDPDEPDPE